jgi:hypothetical protein
VVTDAPTSSVGLAWVRDRHTDLVEEMIGIVRGRTANSTRGRPQDPPARSGEGSAREGGSREGGSRQGGSGQGGSGEGGTGGSGERGRSARQPAKQQGRKPGGQRGQQGRPGAKPGRRTR